MQGIYIIDANGRHTRPPSKVAIRRHLVEYGAGAVYIESTSVFGNEYGGPLSAAPRATITFVGPDPYTSRKYYGNIEPVGDNGSTNWRVK